MMIVEACAMKRFSRRSSGVAVRRRGFTLLEFFVALVVFGIALTGLLPLAAILSRDLQPAREPGEDAEGRPKPKTKKGSTPARDWSTEDYAGKDLDDTRLRTSPWYVTAYDDPWVRKLGASARITSGTLSVTTPLPLGALVRTQDDDNINTDADSDGLQDYEESGTAWDYNASAATAHGLDQHRTSALPAGSAGGYASWKFKVATTGWYSVQATWAAASDQATDVQFTVYKDSVLQTTKVVSQSASPVGVTDSSSRVWASLTSGLTSSSGMLQVNKDQTVEVRLSNVRAASPDATKYVIADAVRLVQNVVVVQSIDRALSGKNQNSNNADVTAKVSVTVGVSQ
jgi:prepilin-type N-terminal cleavage/methylation domain-containing protein